MSDIEWFADMVNGVNLRYHEELKLVQQFVTIEIAQGTPESLPTAQAFIFHHDDCSFSVNVEHYGDDDYGTTLYLNGWEDCDWVYLEGLREARASRQKEMQAARVARDEAMKAERVEAARRILREVGELPPLPEGEEEPEVPKGFRRYKVPAFPLPDKIEVVVQEADPELERLLGEEEAIEQRTREADRGE